MKRETQVQRAGENANTLFEDWTESAKNAVMEYARSKPDGFEFTCEMVRAATANLDEPPHGAWGYVFRSLAKQQRIRRVGFTERANGNPGPVWIRVASERAERKAVANG